MQAATANEDMYVSIIQDLQADRMRMKGKDMTTRLRNLQNDNSAFAKLIKQNQEKENAKPSQSNVKLNAEEQGKIEAAINSVESLKSQFKRKMANARIVDLSKIQATVGAGERPLNPLDVEKAMAEHQKRNTEQFNFLVCEARNKMNDALEFLFQKDSKLRNLKSQTAVTALSSAPEQAADTNEVQIGTLKLRGKIAVPNRKVILDEKALADLRRNVMLLSN